MAHGHRRLPEPLVRGRVSLRSPSLREGQSRTGTWPPRCRRWPSRCWPAQQAKSWTLPRSGSSRPPL